MTPNTYAVRNNCILLIDIFSYFQEEETKNSKDGKGTSYNSFIDSHNEHGDTPLTCAARRGNVNICEILLESNACINETTSNVRQTPLLLAIEHGHEDVVDFLLKNGADVQISDNVNITPLYAAIKGQNLTIIENLIQAGCDINIGSQDHAPLFSAARLGRLDIVKVTVYNNLDVMIHKYKSITMRSRLNNCCFLQSQN